MYGKPCDVCGTEMKGLFVADVWCPECEKKRQENPPGWYYAIVVQSQVQKGYFFPGDSTFLNTDKQEAINRHNRMKNAQNFMVARYKMTEGENATKNWVFGYAVVVFTEKTPIEVVE